MSQPTVIAARNITINVVDYPTDNMTEPSPSQKYFGKIIEYNSHWKGPLKVKRKSTDVRFLISFGIYLAIWIGVAIYAFSAAEVKYHGRGLKNYQSIDISPILEAKDIIIGMIALSLFLSITYIVLLRYYPKVIIFTAIFVLCALLLSVIGYSTYRLAVLKDKSNTTMLVTSVLFFIVTVIILLCNRKKVLIACGVIKEASKVVMFFPSSLIFPIVPYILYGITITFFGSTLIYLSTIHYGHGRSKKTPVHVYIFHLINLFGLLWMTNFINAFFQMVLSGTFATWYWTMDKKHVPKHTLLKFMSITTRFHLGTVAFGSLIMAICESIRLILKNAAKRSSESGNNAGALVLACMAYLFSMVENFIEYINKNAYIMCSIHGTRFLRSGKNAFNLLMRNIMHCVIIHRVAESVLLLGQLLVIGLSVLITYFYCENMEYSVRNTAMISVAVLTGLITLSFFMVLTVAINTVFLCVLEDYERNDGSDERPYFMSYKLGMLFWRNS